MGGYIKIIKILFRFYQISIEIFMSFYTKNIFKLEFIS